MHFAIYQKLIQYCKLTMLQLKKKKKKSRQWHGLTDFEVRIPFAPGGFLAGLLLVS